MRRRLTCSTLAVLVLLAGCGSAHRALRPPGGPAVDPHAKLSRRFGSAEALRAYLASLDQGRPAGTKGGVSKSSGGAVVAAPAAGAQNAPAPAPGTSSITNNQEQGVDEGDIVKAVGDALVVLRQGRLYAVSLRDGMHETDSTRVARTDALNSDVWYDETLVSGDRVYVVGYRYSLPGETANPRDGATEINAFRLANGHFERLTTTFIESWDYYSANNYASRLVDGRLVFYMPFSAMPVYDGYDGAPRPQEPRVPHRLQYDAASNRIVDDGPLFEPGDVFRPFTKPASPMFHSVVRCASPEDGSLQCLTTAVLGDFAREFYVSPTHVYVWTGDRVVMMGLRDGNVSAHSVSGDPSDQFAFHEANGALYVAVHEANAFTMLRLPLSSFDDGGSQSLDGLRTRLGDASYASAERWVGDTFVAAVTPPARPVPMPGPNAPYAGVPVQPGYIVASSLVFFDAGRNGVRTVSINGPVQRIEAAGARALVAVEIAGRLDLRLYDASPRLLSHLDMGDASEGESRSHAFFYSGDAQQGVLGLAIVQDAPGTAHPDGTAWYSGRNGIADVAFAAVAFDGTLQPLGVADTSGNAGACETSCTDWYGNTRPIFIGGRTFALMGSELAEVSLQRPVATVARIDLTFTSASSRPGNP